MGPNYSGVPRPLEAGRRRLFTRRPRLPRKEDGLDRPRWDPIILGSPGPSKLAAGAFLRGDHACLERRGRRQSADRWLTDVEAPRYVGLRFAVKPLHRFLSLMRRQGCRATEFHATSFRALPAIFRASPDQLTLEFSQAAKHSQHQP